MSPYTVLAALIFVCRLLPFFPALASGNYRKFSEIWTLTEGRTFQIFWTFIAVNLPPILVVTALMLVFGDYYFSEYEFLSAKQFINNLTAAFFSLVLLAIGVTTNSEIYRLLVKAPARKL